MFKAVTIGIIVKYNCNMTLSTLLSKKQLDIFVFRHCRYSNENVLANGTLNKPHSKIS